MGADVFHESVAQPSEECLASTSTIQVPPLTLTVLLTLIIPNPNPNPNPNPDPDPNPNPDPDPEPEPNPNDCLASVSIIQGKSLRTFRVGPYVDSVQVLLRSDGMPVNATVEIIQGPNTNRQGIQLYSDNGADKPVFYILETPGYGSVVEVCELTQLDST